MASPLHYLTLSEVCRRIKSGALTSVSVTEQILERIQTLEPTYKSFAMTLADEALETAARLDAKRLDGEPLGVLHGVPIAVKDLLFTRGHATASGTRVMRDFVPDEDATVVDRLKRAGAVIIGKTQLTEGAYGTHHPDIDPPVNPWDPKLWTGVSSSGSGVSVAAGMAYGALGSDTGGSIRFPCASCGLVGIKPTYGRVSRFGAFPLAESLDHIGPMTRTVEDAARMLGVIAGWDEKDATTHDTPVPNYSAEVGLGISGLKIGVDWQYIETGVDATVVATVRESIELCRSLGAAIVDVRMPGSYKTLVDGWGLTTGVECARAHADYYPQQKALYGPSLAELIDYGRSASDTDYQLLEQVRHRFGNEFDDLLRAVDVMIAPCMTSLPPTLDVINDIVASESGRAGFLTFTAPFDYSGHPTITLPAGVTENRQPRAVQLVGKPLAESTLVRVGSALEAELGLMPPALVD